MYTDTNINRRDFIKKAGAFALYTPPTITALMVPSRDSFAQSWGFGRLQDARPINLSKAKPIVDVHEIPVRKK